jgi:ArsR family transcriptional regulator
MEIATAVTSLSALGHRPRLELFRLLVKAGPGGMAAGDIGRGLGAVQNTVSSYLKTLAQAGLVASRRNGRSIIYTANYNQVGDLLRYLIEDCCGGDRAACEAVCGVISNGPVSCC